jgi:hypothetical protein
MTTAPLPAAPTGRGWIRLGQLAWVLAALLALGLVAADAPYRFDQLRTYCSNLCEGGRLPPSEQPVLQRLGLTPDAYAAYTLALYLVQAAACLVVAALLMWRRSNDRIALLAAVMLVALGASSGLTVSTVLPAWAPVFDFLILAGFVSIVYLFYLFPDGRFVPGWSRWAFVPWILWLAMGIGLAALHRPVTSSFWLVLTLLTLALFGLGGLAQIYRFARISDPTQRQQTKWVVAGFALIIAFETLSTLYLDLIGPALGQPAPSGVVFEAASTAVNVLTLIFVPVSLGLAIFRHRLWDIDVILRRTLIYSIITVLLALAYFASVLALQTAFGALIGQGQSTLVTVLSTLVIAALFVPVRARVQAGIDRGFYRRRYDAARILAAFGASMRDDLELERLTERLLDAVEHTMEPASATLWIKPVD